MIFYLLFLAIAILICKHIYEIHNTNKDATLEQLQSANKEDIFERLKERKPLLIHNLGNKNEEYNQLSFVYGSSQQSEYLHQNFGIMFVDTTN